MKNMINKTFAQKLREHNKFCENTLKQFDELLYRARGVDATKSKQLSKQAEKLLKSTDSAMREFEIKYAKELSILKTY